MNFEFEITGDLTAEPGEGQRYCARSKAGAVDGVARCVPSQRPEKGAQQEELCKIRKEGKCHCAHGIKIARNPRNQNMHDEINKYNSLRQESTYETRLSPQNSCGYECDQTNNESWCERTF